MCNFYTILVVYAQLCCKITVQKIKSMVPFTFIKIKLYDNLKYCRLPTRCLDISRCASWSSYQSG